MLPEIANQWSETIHKSSKEYLMSILEVVVESFFGMNLEQTLLTKQIGRQWKQSIAFADYGLVISHVKSECRMIRSFLKGIEGNLINTLMAAAAYNMRHWMNKNALPSFVSWLKTLVEGFEKVIFGNENRRAFIWSTLETVA